MFCGVRLSKSAAPLVLELCQQIQDSFPDLTVFQADMGFSFPLEFRYCFPTLAVSSSSLLKVDHYWVRRRFDRQDMCLRRQCDTENGVFGETDGLISKATDADCERLARKYVHEAFCQYGEVVSSCSRMALKKAQPCRRCWHLHHALFYRLYG